MLIYASMNVLNVMRYITIVSIIGPLTASIIGGPKCRRNRQPYPG